MSAAESNTLTPQTHCFGFFFFLMELISDEMEKDQNVDGADGPGYNELQVGFEFPCAVVRSSR